MIAIIDYDAGNLKSVEKALLALGEECVVTRDHDSIRRADRVVLPGVGSFEMCIRDRKKSLESCRNRAENTQIFHK